MTGHAFVVGGSGMLAGAVRGLVADGWRISDFSRRASDFAASTPGVLGFNCDYREVSGFTDALARATALQGAPRLAVAWLHDVRLPAARRLAEVLVPPARYVQVLGSGVCDPDRPDRLAAAEAAWADLEHVVPTQVILGFRIEGARARWNTNDEIADGVLRAIRSGARRAVVGQVQPWSARPTS